MFWNSARVPARITRYATPVKPIGLLGASTLCSIHVAGPE